MSFRLPLVLGIVLITASCGFRPLYVPTGTNEAGSSGFALETFSKVNISRIADREGQFLRNKLIELMHPAGKAKVANYNLGVKLSESKASLAVRRSSDATRANLTVTAQYLLLQLDTQKTLVSGVVQSTSGYNIFESEFQTLSAEKSARDRALIDLAHQVRLRIATAFAADNFENPDPKKQK